MYRIKTADKIYYTDAIRYIRLHKNGCYVACLHDVAEGICAKVYASKEDGSAVLDDKVFALNESKLQENTEVALSIEKDPVITIEELFAGQQA